MSRLGSMRFTNSSNLTISRQASVNWIMLIYFTSGACSLIDEVVWVRLLKLTLGNTVYASSIVVSVFMGGLALGALIMSRYCDRVRRRLKLYALLETLVTISALSLPWALKLADTFYIWFYRAYNPTHTQLLIVQVIISAMVLLVPSMLMGSTLPLLGRFVTAIEKQAGHLVGRLYALNTLGAAAGCFLAGFILVRAIGVMGALYTAAVLNLLVACGGWALSRFSMITDEPQPAVAAAAESTHVVEAKKTDGKFFLLILAFFMSGLISIGYELLWMRSIVHLLGGFTYVFSAVLTVYLLGNVIGAGIGSRLAIRLKRPAAGFAVTLSLLGLCGSFYLSLLIFWTSTVMPYVKRAFETIYSHMPVSSYTAEPLVQSVFLFLVPAIIMGIGFPIALQAWANHMHKVGRSTGTAYAVNTIGAVTGGIVTGFVLIPLLGLQFSIAILSLIGVWIAGIMWLLFAHNSKIIGRWALLGVAVFVTVYTVKAPSDLFNTMVELRPNLPKGFVLLSMKEGVTATVSVHRDLKDDSLHMHSSGQSIAGDRYALRGDQKILGHLGVLLKTDAKKVLSVGFGSGETTACLAQHKLERVDCVEIAPEVVEVSLQFFRHINLGDKLDDEVNMIYMDAKNYIHLMDGNYDVIVNDAIHPRDFAENASLYGKEYFESAKQRLNKNKGLFLSWLPTYDMSASVLKSIIGTAMEVFPHFTLWYLTTNPAPLVVIVGSEQQQYFSLKHIENELLKDGVRNSLSEIGIYKSMDVLSCYIGDENDLSKHITDFSINSDYFPFVEFNTDSKEPKWQIFRQFVMDVRTNSVYDHIDWTGFSEEEKSKWLKGYQQLREASTYLFMACGSTNDLDKLKYSVEGLSVLPDNPALLHGRAGVEKALLLDGVEMVLAGDTDNALALADRILEVHPKSAIAWIIKSSAISSKGDMQGALSAARQAVDIAPEKSEAHFNLGFTLFRLGQFDKAITEYEQAMASKLVSFEQVQILDALISTYAAAGRLADAIATAEKAIDIASSTGQKDIAERISKRLLSLKATHTNQQQH
ncbi:MAG: fused MFS/spermidine synthase [Planctomycetota bacterium]|nr:MAG: fused MFS/spermidine synthase [Planctomycetota bacterium]